MSEKMKPEEVIDAKMNYLLGEILTVVDALVPAPDQAFYGGSLTSTTVVMPTNTQSQNTAVKSLIRASFGRARKDMQDWIK